MGSEDRLLRKDFLPKAMTHCTLDDNTTGLTQQVTQQVTQTMQHAQTYLLSISGDMERERRRFDLPLSTS
jgi:hypothetical protein